MEYENIKNLHDLILRVKYHGLAMDSESICKVQDILGHSTVNEMDDVAEGNFRSTLFQIVFSVWDYDRATKFYNDHNGVNAELRHKEAELAQIKKEMEQLKESAKKLKDERDSIAAQVQNIRVLTEQHEAEQLEIMKLKAKLYDLMVNAEEKEVV